MILAIKQNLERGMNLLQNISDSNYCDNSVAPYYSSIGIHMRHVLDVFECVFEGLPEGQINLVNRSRNRKVEEERQEGLNYFKQILTKLERLSSEDFGQLIAVTDDLGTGPVVTTYTLGAILAQAHSHAIHHYASIGYVIAQLGIELPDSMFGFNPTTPKEIIQK